MDKETIRNNKKTSKLKEKPKTYTVVNYTDQTIYSIYCSNSATYIPVLILKCSISAL